MAKLYISEYRNVLGTAQIAAGPPLAVQVVDFSGGAAASAAFSAQTAYVRLHNDSICSLRFDGTATTAYPRSPADTIEYYGVTPGSTVSAIINT